MNKALAINRPNLENLTRLSFRRLGLAEFLPLFRILTIISIAALLAFYIFQVNAETSERYLIQSYNLKLSEISKENQSLELSSFQINSLDKIVELLEPLNFEKTGKIHYIRTLDKQVVAK